MRDIKFRGKAYATGEWIYGSLVCHQNGTVDICDDRIGDYRDMRVNRDTVGEYTGLTDADGKEIYEGDIIESEGYGVLTLHVVKWDVVDACFSVYMCEKYCGPLKQRWIDEYGKTVVGNIHDDAELYGKGGLR